MRVELALFDGDALLERGEIRVSTDSSCDHLELFHIAHRLRNDAAQVVLSNFSPRIKLNTVRLDMPVHHSSDWESIDLAGYTLAFRCWLDALHQVGAVVQTKMA
jgi:hypothetical protein